MNNSLQGSKLYLAAITMVAILGGLLFGYDTAVISGAEQAMQQFFIRATDFVYTPSLHGLTSSSALIGCVIGGAISGLFATRLGRRNSLIVAAVLFFISAMGSYYPEFLFFEYGKPTQGLLVAFNIYRIIGGVGVGMASAICPMYIAELAPANVRGTLVSCNQLAIIFGMLVVYFVNYMIKGSLPVGEELSVIGASQDSVNQVISSSMVTTGWRRMFLSEAFPAALFGILLFLVPKTPRYLVMIGQESNALKVLARINGHSNANVILNDIKATTKQKSEPILTYGLVVIVIGILLSFFQQAVGINVVLYYAPRIFASMGATGDTAMVQTVVMGIINLVFTVVAIVTVDKWGRKPLLIVGSIGMMVGMIALGVLSYMNLIGIAALIFIIIYTASFMMSWGPICWVLIAEIFPNTIRGKAVAIAVAAQWIANFAVSATFIPLSSWSLGGTYLIYALFCFLSVIFVWKMVPETKGKTLEQMSELFKRRG